MLTKADIADIVSRRLAEYTHAGIETSHGAATRPISVAKASRPLPKRVFISDWEIKRMVVPGRRTVTVPANAIISPLSQDWLDYDGIEVLR